VSWLTAGLAALSLLAGCGSPEGDLELPGSDTKSAVLTRDAFASQANAICRATTKEIVERVEKTGSGSLDGSGGGDRRKLVEVIQPVTKLAVSRLRNLTPPAADAELARRAVDTIQAAADGAASDDTLPLDPIGLNQPEFFDYGLTGCFTKR
jgi:hypothetical protein